MDTDGHHYLHEASEVVVASPSGRLEVPFSCSFVVSIEPSMNSKTRHMFVGSHHLLGNRLLAKQR